MFFLFKGIHLEQEQMNNLEFGEIRIGVPIFMGRRGDDPGSVIYDGLNFGLNRGFKKFFH